MRLARVGGETSRGIAATSGKVPQLDESMPETRPAPAVMQTASVGEPPLPRKTGLRRTQVVASGPIVVPRTVRSRKPDRRVLIAVVVGGGIMATLAAIAIMLLALPRDDRNKPTHSLPVARTNEKVPHSFTIQVDPAHLVLAQGDRARLKVTAGRKGYEGPIELVLLGNPGGLNMGRAMLGRGIKEVDMELRVDMTAPVGDQQIKVQGTALDMNNLTALSGSLTVSVSAAPEVLVKVEPSQVTLLQGGKVRFKVIAQHKGYQGRMNVQVSNLPGQVTFAVQPQPAPERERG